MQLKLVGVFIITLVAQSRQLFLAQGVCTGPGNQWLTALSCDWPLTSPTEGSSLCPLSLKAVAQEPFLSGWVRYFNLAIGFVWTVPILGFIILGNNVLTLALLKPRQSFGGPGELLRDPTYILFCLVRYSSKPLGPLFCLLQFRSLRSGCTRS